MTIRDILITDRTARLPSDYAPQDSQDLQAPSDAPAGHGGAGNGIVAFRVDCIPVAQPRQRHAVIAGHVRNYLPTNHPVQQFKHEIRQAFAWKRPDGWNVTRPMEVRLVFVFPRPASKTRKRGENPPYPKAGKPDADNLAKAVLDALNGLAWNDDSQVAILYVAKWVGEPGRVPGVTVTIEAIE
jgi:Holliday junction resolvase RusA-like endonuclease